MNLCVSSRDVHNDDDHGGKEEEEEESPNSHFLSPQCICFNSLCTRG